MAASAGVIDPDSAPLMIGVTGKRKLGGQDDAVRAALAACFDLLDRHLHHSPKILLTGLASGTDTIATEEARGRPGWTIVATLPLDDDLYAQDFDDAADARRFRALVGDQRVRVRTLEPLCDPRTGQPFTPHALARVPGTSNPDRTDHYEQVGIFIAERCALLIAVMPDDEQPDDGKVGGTARVISYRLRGADAVARRIIGQSRELRPHDDLDSPQTGPVWLIDPNAAARTGDAPLRSVQLWESAPAKSPRLDGSHWPLVSLLRGLWKPAVVDHGSPPEIVKRHPGARALVAAARLAGRIDEFNACAHWASSQPFVARRAAAIVGDDASSMLHWSRLVASAVQGWNKIRLSRTLFGLACLFVLAVGSLEVYIEFGLWWGVLTYTVLFGAILGVYFWAKRHLYQQYSEDYRAVAEALRVQLAWWDAGLTGAEHRVDRSYLRGTTGSLALVRAAVRHLVDAALLEKAFPRPSPERVREWVRSQVDFFKGRIEDRHVTLLWFEGFIWFFFVASLGMAATLLVPTHETAESAGHAESPLHWDVGIPYLLAGILVAGILSHVFSRLGKEQPFGRRWVLYFVNFIVTLAAGAALATVVYRMGGLASGYLDPTGCSAACGPASHKLVTMAMVVSVGLAAALRFLTERLAWEAELHSYRETFGNFVRAENALTRQPPIASRETQALLVGLGQLALEENESWIRAHRVQPLEPVY
jgi:hypothetical protein